MTRLRKPPRRRIGGQRGLNERSDRRVVSISWVPQQAEGHELERIDWLHNGMTVLDRKRGNQQNPVDIDLLQPTDCRQVGVAKFDNLWGYAGFLERLALTDRPCREKRVPAASLAAGSTPASPEPQGEEQHEK